MGYGYLKDQSYLFLSDAVVDIEGIEYLSNVREELQELEKVLKPEGIIVFKRDWPIPLLIHPILSNNLKKWDKGLGYKKGHMTYKKIFEFHIHLPGVDTLFKSV